MSAIASSVTGFNVGNYPRPTGYHIYVTSSTGVVDNTTQVYTYNINDQYREQCEMTSVTFIAIFKDLAPYEFNGISFYTQVNGQDFMEVAGFVFSSTVQKPSNYVLVMFITFSISTPTQSINPIQDVIQECGQYCQDVDCNSVANNIYKSFIPFSLFNLVFLHMLGITLQDLNPTNTVTPQMESYFHCTDNCNSLCNSNNSVSCPLCILGCIALLQQNPIVTFATGNNIGNLTQLLPQGINTIYGINVCSGNVATFQPQNVQTGLNIVSPSEVQYIVQFSLPSTNNFFNALQILVSTSSNNNYSLGVLYFVGVPLPSGETFTLTVTVSQSQGGQGNGS